MAVEHEIERLVVRLIGDGAEYQRMLKDAQATAAMAAREIERSGKRMESVRKQLESVAAGMRNVGRQMRDAGRTMSLAVTAPLAGLGAFAVKSGADFESGFAGVRKTIDATEAEFAAMRQGFKDLATEVPVATTELLAIGEIAGSLGIANGSVLSFTRTIADLTATTNMTADEGAAAMAQFANITRMPQSAFSNLGSTLVALGNSSSSTERDIMNMAMRLAGAGSTVRMTVPQIMGVATALTDVGIEAEAGGTAFSQLFLKMAQSVATGSKELQVFARASGKSAGEFSALFRQDAAAAVQEMLRGLSGMGMEERIRSIEQMGVEGVRMTDAILRTSNAVDKFGASMRTADSAFRENTALAKEAEQRYRTFWSRVQLVRNEIGLAAGELFDAFQPALTRAVAAVRDGVQWFRGLSDETKRWLVIAAGAAASVGPLLVGLGMMTGALGLAVRGLSLLMSPLALAVRAVTGVGGAFAAFGMSAVSAMATAGNAVRSLASGAVSSLTASVASLPALLSPVGSMAAGAFRLVSGAAMASVVAFRSLPGAAAVAVSRMLGYSGAFRRGWTGEIALATTRGNLAMRQFGEGSRYWLTRPVAYLNAAFPAAMANVRRVGSQAVAAVKAQWSALRGHVQAVTAAVSAQWSAAQSAVVSAASRAWSAVSSVVVSKAAASNSRVVALAGAAAQQVGAAYSRVSGAVSAAFAPIAARVRSALAPILPLIRQDAAKIRGYLSAAGVAAAASIKASMGSAFMFVRTGAVAAGLAVRRMGGGLLRIVDAAAMVAVALGSFGGRAAGAMGTFASMAPALLLVVPAITAISAALLSWPGLILMAGAAWATLTGSGRKAVASVRAALGELPSIAGKAFGGIVNAIKAGDFALAGRVAVAGLRAAFAEGLSLIGADQSEFMRAIGADILQGDFAGAWQTVLMQAQRLWAAWSEGVVKMFANSINTGVRLWQQGVEGMANWMLKKSAEGGAVGHSISALLGVDLQEEQARADEAQREIVGIWQKRIGGVEGQIQQAQAAGNQGAVDALNKTLAEYRAALASVQGEGQPDVLGDASRVAAEGVRGMSAEVEQNLKDITAQAEAATDAATDALGERTKERAKPFDRLAADARANLDAVVAEANAAKAEADKAGQEVGDAMGGGVTDAMGGAADAVGEFDGMEATATLAVEGRDAVETDTAEAMARVQEFLDGNRFRPPKLPAVSMPPVPPVTVPPIKPPSYDVPLPPGMPKPDIAGGLGFPEIPVELRAAMPDVEAAMRGMPQPDDVHLGGAAFADFMRRNTPDPFGKPGKALADAPPAPTLEGYDWAAYADFMRRNTPPIEEMAKDIPALRMPAVDAPKVPDIAVPDVPRMPDLAMPDVPAIDAPRMPDMAGLTMPPIPVELKAVGIDMGAALRDMPQIPAPVRDFAVPEMPPVPAPDLTGFPSLPLELRAPAIPDMPALPEIPSLPELRVAEVAQLTVAEPRTPEVRERSMPRQDREPLMERIAVGIDMLVALAERQSDRPVIEIDTAGLS